MMKFFSCKYLHLISNVLLACLVIIKQVSVSFLNDSSNDISELICMQHICISILCRINKREF